MIFMIKSICFSLYKETSSATQSRNQQTSLILDLQVCNQGSTNVKAIEELVSNIVIGDHQFMCPLYDVLHVLKGTRNNFLSKDNLWNLWRIKCVNI